MSSNYLTLTGMTDVGLGDDGQLQGCVYIISFIFAGMKRGGCVYIMTNKHNLGLNPSNLCQH